MADDGPDWLGLPGDVTAMILRKLGPAELLEGAQFVCKAWWEISKDDPSFWRSIDINLFEGSDSRREMMTRRAVDLSRGQLVDIKISGRQLLPYVAERARQLRRLETRLCPPDQWKEAASKLPLLEELHMSARYARPNVLRAIGNSCQQLKSLHLVKDFPGRGEGTDDREALAIGKTMPRLQHLELSALEFSRFGLLAILDGCPHLQSFKLFNYSRAGVLAVAKGYAVQFLFDEDQE